MLDRKKLGERLLQWHSSGGDPIYAVGSYFISGDCYPDKSVVQRALSGIVKCREDRELLLSSEMYCDDQLMVHAVRQPLRSRKVRETRADIADLKEIETALGEYLVLDFARGKPKPYQATTPERKVLRGRLYFEARVRWVGTDTVNDRVMTIIGRDDMEVARAAKGAAAQLNRDAQ